MPELSDPPLDDLTPMRAYLRPSTFEPAPPRVLPEPPDGSVLRFTKGRRYTYVAVRRGDHWETASTSDWQPITEVLKWHDLARKVRAFEIATSWAPVNALHHLRHVSGRGHHQR